MRAVWVVKALAMGALSVFICGAQTASRKPGTPPPAPLKPEPGVLHQVKVEGNHIYATAAIVKVLGLKIGGPIAPPDFEVAKQRLVNTELFSNVEYEFSFTKPPDQPEQYDLVMKVAEYAEVLPMKFEDLGVSEDEIRSYLRANLPLYNDRIPGTDMVVQRYRALVQERVAQKNPALKVTGRVVPDDSNQLALLQGKASRDAPNEMVVLFRPNTPPPSIARVMVNGNKAVQTQEILKAINEVAVGTPYSDERLQLILDHAVKGLYEAQGYVHVTFPIIRAEKAANINGYDVTVTIQEGPKYNFGPIAFRGGDLDQDTVKSMLKFKVGDVFNGAQAEDLRIALIAEMRRKGHLLAKADIERNLDDEKHTVNLRYLMEPGPLYTFDTLEIHGLDIESEPVIRKMWAEQPGKPFNPDYPAYFLKKVEEAQLFDNLGDTRSDFTPNESTHGVKVDLYFKGGNGSKKKERERGRGEGGPPGY